MPTLAEKNKFNFHDKANEHITGLMKQWLENDRAVDIIINFKRRGKRVILSGLDKDFRGEPFGNMPKALALADSITKLTAICVKCGKDANCTQRIIDNMPASYDDPLILVGAKESYEARCDNCHEVPGKKYKYDI